MSDETAYLRDLDRRHVWHPFTQMKEWEQGEPVIITRGEGSWLIDTEGNRYLDGVASLWTNVHGHCRKEIGEAIKEQVDRLEHSTLLGLSSDRPVILAKRLVEIAPEGLTRVFYSDNGSTAMEVAVKMAFQYQQHRGGDAAAKTRFITFTHAYHGDTLGAVSVGGIDLYHEVFRPLLFDSFKAPAPYCYRCPYGSESAPECGFRCLDALEEIMKEHAGTVAGLVIEPLVQGAGGMIVQPEGFVRKVRELCTRYDILMIADEVAVGFGRTGAMFACGREGVTPDLMALSKGISGGYLPLAATLATEQVYGMFLGEYREMKTFFHGHTFTGNPLACAAALASLEIFDREQLLKGLEPKMSYLAGRMAQLARLPHVGQARHLGMIGGIELVPDKEKRDEYPWEERVGVRVGLEARKHGLFLRPLGNIIVVFPPLSISLEEMRQLFDGIEASIRSVTG